MRAGPFELGKAGRPVWRGDSGGVCNPDDRGVAVMTIDVYKRQPHSHIHQSDPDAGLADKKQGEPLPRRWD